MIIGGVFFGSHWPEKWHPRVCDIACPSHTLWHIFYLTCLVFTFDVFAVIFFGASPYTADNFVALARSISRYLIVFV
jgi:predicted membrane channel-forming protein YqfA (hemolysin III family)